MLVLSSYYFILNDYSNYYLLNFYAFTNLWMYMWLVYMPVINKWQIKANKKKWQLYFRYYNVVQRFNILQ